MTLVRRLKSATAELLYRTGAIGLYRRILSPGRGIALMYHRVNDLEDPFFPSLPVSIFARQLDYLARHYRVEPLERMVEWAASGAKGPPRVALTIDDGYPDTFEHMLPELDRRGLQATLFLCTLPVDTGRPLWTDRLRHSLKHATRDSLDLSSHGLEIGALRTVPDRLLALRFLMDELKRRAPAFIEEVSSTIEEQLRPAGPEPRTLTWEQVRSMSSSGRFTIGAHTHRHYVLSHLTDSEIEEEIRTSAGLIERHVGPVHSFCYPNGRERDYDHRSVNVLRSMGIRCAVMAESGFVLPTSDPLELPRISTSERNLSVFAARLAGIGSLKGPSSVEAQTQNRAPRGLEVRP